MSALGLDPAASSLTEARKYFASQDLPSHVEHVLTLANVTDVVMTNDPFDPLENSSWKSKSASHPRFHAALRLDSLLHCWSDSYRVLEAQGYAVSETLSPRVIAEARRFLDSQIERMRPLYAAASFRYDFTYGGESTGERLLREVTLPTLAAHRIPFAIMIGVARGVNPELKGGGDGVGKAGYPADRARLFREPRGPVSGHRAFPGKSARALRLGAKVQQPDAVRMLVVPQ